MAGTEETTEQGTGHCPKSIGSTGSSSSEDLPNMNNIHFLFITKKEKNISYLSLLYNPGYLHYLEYYALLLKYLHC